MFALNDFLGELRFLRITWLTILVIAFSSINFAGFTRLFTPQHGFSKPKEVWYLFGAWLVAATMNAMLTWWGVTLTIVNLQSVGISVIKNQILIKIIPVFLSIMIWLIRILIIGTSSKAGDRLFSQLDGIRDSHGMTIRNTAVVARSSQPQPAAFQSTHKSSSDFDRNPINHPEPTDHPAGLSEHNSSYSHTRR